MKKVWKIILVILIFISGFAIGLATKYYIDEWKAKRNVALWMDSLDPFKNDKYGGATPEETFDMYLTALKKGDLELASKYFYATKQQQQLEFLKGQEESKKFNEYILKLETMEKDWKIEESNDSNIKLYFYEEVISENIKSNFLGKETIVPAGKYGRDIRFDRVNNIWKIYSL